MKGEAGEQGEIRTHRRLKNQRVYSASPLTAWIPTQRLLAKAPRIERRSAVLETDILPLNYTLVVTLFRIELNSPVFQTVAMTTSAKAPNIQSVYIVRQAKFFQLPFVGLFRPLESILRLKGWIQKLNQPLCR